MLYRWICCFAVVIASLLPSLVLAQDTVDLIVTIRDVADMGVANVQVTIRDRTGERDLVRGVTDVNGVAVIQKIIVSDIRIGLVGALSNGQSLLLRGDDAQGIRVFLGAGTTTVDLRVENDGTVIPDPSEIVQEVTQSNDTLLTQPTATPANVVMPTVAALPSPVPTNAATPAAPGAVEQKDGPRADALWPMVVIGVFGTLIVGVLVVGKRL